MKKAVLVALLVGLIMTAGNAFALAPGTEFDFIDSTLVSGTSWIHSITDANTFPSVTRFCLQTPEKNKG